MSVEPTWVPGPWRVSVDDGVWVVTESDTVSCREIAITTNYCGHRRRLANAHLIAAAPALYEALVRIVKHHGTYIYDLPGTHGVSDIEAANTAVAKARGERA